MEFLFIIGLGLFLAVVLSLWLLVHLIRTKGGAGATGKADTLAKLDTDEDRVIVDWPTLWSEPTVAEVVKHAAARGYRLESQAGDKVTHVLTFTRI